MKEGSEGLTPLGNIMKVFGSSARDNEHLLDWISSKLTVGQRRKEEEK